MQNEWTVLIYFNADNSEFDSALKKDFDAFSAIGSSGAVTFLAAVDQSSNSDAVHVKPTIHLIRKGITMENSTPVYHFNQQNLARELALKEFFRYAKKYHPAKRYIIVFWDHGSLLRLDAMNDRVGENDMAFLHRAAYRRKYLPYKYLSRPYQPGQTKSGKNRFEGAKDLYLISISRAIKSVFPNGIDILCFDACDQQMLEVNLALKANTRFIVAAEGLINFSGLAYTETARILLENPMIESRVLAQEITQLSFKKYQSDIHSFPRICLSCIETLRTAEIAIALDALCAVMIKHQALFYDKIEFARLTTEEFNDDSHFTTGIVDLLTLFSNFRYILMDALDDEFENDEDKKTILENALDLCNQLLQSIRNAVVINKVSAAYKFDETKAKEAQRQFGATGLSIFFPMDLSLVSYFAFYFTETHYNRPFAIPELNFNGRWPKMILSLHKKRMTDSLASYAYEAKVMRKTMKSWFS